MAVNVKSSFKVNATMVSDEFIDDYMASANGEYIKEYLFLLRHEGEELTLPMIADALNHTESDVARALSYWKKAGVLKDTAVPVKAVSPRPEAPAPVESRKRPEGRSEAVRRPEEQKSEVNLQPDKRPVYSPEQIGSLAGDEDFSQLLYIAQKYMNKVFTQRECEVFAYLYDGLHMTAELLEYVVEYCVQGGHSSIRYIETVAISWHEKGFKTVDEAKAYASTFSKDSFAVMRAFGLSDRKPGDSERELIGRWFSSYGFTKELVLEACNRTMANTHTPSFQYADKILSGWKKAGVRLLEDVKRLDEQYAGRAKPTEHKTAGTKPRTAQNQFQNFPQRDVDYDALVLQQLKEQ